MNARRESRIRPKVAVLALAVLALCLWTAGPVSAKKPPKPPFKSLLKRALKFEETMESHHYSTYMDLEDGELKELLLQLTRFDTHHVAMLKEAINQL